MIAEKIEEFIKSVNSEFGSDLATDSQGEEGEISINWPGHGHIYVDAESGAILDKTKLRGGLIDKLRDALTPPKPKNDPRPTARQAANGMARAFAPAVRDAPVRDIQVADLTMEDIKGYICPAATDQEAFMFLKLCQARNLNPFTNEAYLVKYGSKATMIVGKEAFMRKAEHHPKYEGFRAGILVARDEEGDGLDAREGTFIMKGDILLGGWCEVFRSDRKHPIKAEVSLKDFKKSGSGPWQDMPAVMIRKIAIVQAHREAFPSDLSGCYDSSEFRDAIDIECEVEG